MATDTTDQIEPTELTHVETPYIDYHSICVQVHRAVLNVLERRAEIHKRFLPYDATLNILDDDLLGRLFDSLSSLTDTPSASSLVTREDKVKRVKTRKLYDLLAVLLYSSCDIAAATAFHEKLVLVGDERWEEINLERERNKQSPLGTLPLESDDAETIFGTEKNDIIWDNIVTDQPIFCPLQLWENGELVLEDSRPYRFPYKEEVAIGEGYSGKVYRVKIATGYFLNKKDNSVNDAEIELARKDYNTEENHIIRNDHTSSGRRIREEKEIIQLLTRFRSHPNIVKTLGAYEIGPTYSLFLELAADDLKRYLSSGNEKLTSPEAKAQFLRCAVGLASGLTFLHEGIQLPDYETAVCYHLDLKPDNVLVFRHIIPNELGQETTNSAEIRPPPKEITTWKISDFGVAVLKTRREQQGEVRNRPRKWFWLENGYSEFSGTQNPRLQGTYLAPESEISLRDMGAHSDVWSLGCMMSMLLTYLESGWSGVEDYKAERCEDRQIKMSDQFFRPPVNWTDFKLNSRVLQQHQYLTRQARDRESRDGQALPGEGNAIEHFLDFLEKYVLVTSWRQRKATARDIETELIRLAEFYESPTVSETAATAGSGVFTFHNVRSWTRKLLSRGHDPGVDGTSEQRQWFLIPGHVNIKASIITLNGKIIAFWSNEYIRLYTPETLNERPPKGKLKSYGMSDELGQKTCYWESVDLNQEFLIASTNRNNFDCYVYEIDNENVNGPVLDKKYRIFLQLPKIRRVAISPNSEWFVCVVSHKQESFLPGRLFHARMENVLEVAKMRSNVTEENIASRTPDLASLVAWEEPITLASAAADLTYLTVSKKNIVFAVLQPSTDAESNQHSIILHSFDIPNRRFHTIKLESPPMEYSTVSFFTAFAPFRKQNACAIVTREHRFHVQYFSDNLDHPGDVVQSVHSYRLLEIIMDLKDETVFALGTVSANSDVWLLRFPLPKSNRDDIVISKVERLHNIFYDDDCALSISKEDSTKYMLISVARGIMYRLDLSRLCR